MSPPSPRERFSLLFDPARSPLYTFPQEWTKPASSFTWCLLHLTNDEPASSYEASTPTTFLKNNEEDDTKETHKIQPYIIKNGFLAQRFVVRKACNQWSVRIKIREIWNKIWIEEHFSFEIFLWKLNLKWVKELSLGSSYFWLMVNRLLYIGTQK